MKIIYVYILICIFAVLLVCLCGCSHDLSQSMTSSVQEDLTILSEDVAKTPDCAQFKPKIDAISNRVKLISDACESEKSSISKSSRNKSIIIVLLLSLMAGMVYTSIRK